MQAIKTQDEQIREKLLEEPAMQEWDDEIKPAGLEQMFRVRKEKGYKTKMTTVRSPQVKKLHRRTIAEQARYLASLANYKAGVMSIEWTIGTDTVNVGFVESYPHPEEMTEIETQDLADVLANLLKSRRFLKKFKWDFLKGATLTCTKHPLDITPY